MVISINIAETTGYLYTKIINLNPYLTTYTKLGCMILFLYKTLENANYRNRKQISVCQRKEVGG